MANGQFVKWRAAGRLFKNNQRCPAPPFGRCIWTESKCEGCEILKAEMKAVIEDDKKK